MNIYRDIILDHYQNPRNFGHLTNPDITGQEYNVSCGDRITMDIMLNKRGSSKISAIRFSGDGCAISQASASMLTEKVKAMSLTKVRLLSLRDILSMLGTELTPSRVKCALLPLEVLQKALSKV